MIILSKREKGNTTVMAKTASTTMSSKCECMLVVMFEPYVVASDTAAKRWSENLSTAISTAIMRVVIAVESLCFVLSVMGFLLFENLARRFCFFVRD